MQKKYILFGLLLILILSTVTPISVGNVIKISDLEEQSTMVCGSGNIFYVGGFGEGNYSSIQEAIDDADDGDMVYVYGDSSPYCESITIDKRIILNGEDADSTIIYGCNTKDSGITVTANNVVIQNLTIKNFRYTDRYSPWDQAGIKIYNSDVTVKNNRLVSNRIGIEIYTSAYNITIKNNELINDGVMIGNYFVSSEYPQMTISNFLHNIENNTVNGKPLYYYVGMNDFVMPSDAGQIILVNCSNVTIKDIQMSNNDFSLILAYCSNCLLENLTIFDTDGENLFFECYNNIIQNNTIYNTFKAFCFEYKSNNNIVRYNNVSNNCVGLSIFTDANNNSIYKNKAYNNEHAGLEIITLHGGTQRDNNISQNVFYDNKVGIYLFQNSVNNTIYKNTIKNNRFGILLRDKSCCNEIIKNNIQKNLISVLFLKCRYNTWHGNYWNRPRILPKSVFGLGLYGMPRINIDWRPALKPYDIDLLE